MKPIRTLVIALLGYTAALVPGLSQAHGVELSLPGVSVRLPAPPILLPLPVPQIVVRGGYAEYGPEYRRMPPPPPRYYYEDYRRERWEVRHHHDHHDHGRRGHDGDGWRH
ncbi:MAG TPA: hypothetical protein VLC92_01920 [Rhodocyclaceae bacterium]|nr:hypothetical protein [Rhodocyclaceae bacterium]